MYPWASQWQGFDVTSVWGVKTSLTLCVLERIVISETGHQAWDIIRNVEICICHQLWLERVKWLEEASCLFLRSPVALLLFLVIWSGIIHLQEVILSLTANISEKEVTDLVVFCHYEQWQILDYFMFYLCCYSSGNSTSAKCHQWTGGCPKDV